MRAEGAAERVLWDVVDEHLAEADYLFRAWTSALESPLHTLATLERGLEARLLAHVEALEVNDPALLDCLPESLRQRLRDDAAAPTGRSLFAQPEDYEALLDHADPGVVAAARAMALSAGSQVAFERCVLSASYASRVDAQAMLVVALLGAPAHHATLVDNLSRPTHQHAALFALGYTGQLAFVPLLLAQLALPEPRTRKLAAEAIATLTGLDLSLPELRAPISSDDDTLPSLVIDRTRDLVPTPVDDLPLVRDEAVAEWWAARPPQLSDTARVLLGEPWTPASVLRALEQLPLRRRPPLALWLRVSTEGRVQLDTRALVRTQHTQIERARAALAAAEAPAVAPRLPSWRRPCGR